MSFGLYSGADTQRMEFVRVRGPMGKGHAELAVTKPPGEWGGGGEGGREVGEKVSGPCLWREDDVEYELVLVRGNICRRLK